MIRIDMPMPENCRMCPACSEYDICLIHVDGKDFYDKDVSEFIEGRPDWCPLHDEHEVCVNCPMNPVRPTWQQGKAYCGQCGKRIPLKINANYCHKCGREINWLP